MSLNPANQQVFSLILFQFLLIIFCFVRGGAVCSFVRLGFLLVCLFFVVLFFLLQKVKSCYLWLHTIF